MRGHKLFNWIKKTKKLTKQEDDDGDNEERKNIENQVQCRNRSTSNMYESVCVLQWNWQWKLEMVKQEMFTGCYFIGLQLFLLFFFRLYLSLWFYKSIGCDRLHHFAHWLKYTAYRFVTRSVRAFALTCYDR